MSTEDSLGKLCDRASLWAGNCTRDEIFALFAAKAAENAQLRALLGAALEALDYYASAPWVGHAGSWANSNIAERANSILGSARKATEGRPISSD